MTKNQPVMPAHRLHGFMISVCVRYRKGMPIENAVLDAIDGFPFITANAAARIRNAAIKELKKNSDWDHKRPSKA